MRTVQIDMSTDRPSYPHYFGGHEGEHNETEIVVTLPSRMISDKIKKYQFVFETAAGEVIHSVYCNLSGNKVSILLWQQLTVARCLKVCVAGYGISGEEYTLIAKTGAATLDIKNDISGDEVEIDASQIITKDDIRELLYDVNQAKLEAQKASADAINASNSAVNSATAAETARQDCEDRHPIVTKDISNSAVTTDKLADDSVSTDKLADGAVTPEKTDFAEAITQEVEFTPEVRYDKVNAQQIYTLMVDPEAFYKVNLYTSDVQGGYIEESGTDGFHVLYVYPGVGQVVVTVDSTRSCTFYGYKNVRTGVRIPKFQLEPSSVTTDAIKNRAVTKSKLGDDVLDMLSGVPLENGTDRNAIQQTGATASGFYAIAFGQQTTAKGINSFASGSRTYAAGNNSVALGMNTVASGDAAFAAGDTTTASDRHAMAMGQNSSAEKADAFAFGYRCYARGEQSAAIGRSNQANGNRATATGQDTVAAGECSFAGGKGTTANGFCQAVFGKYNAPDSTSLFMVGNGEPGAVKNALIVRNDGRLINNGQLVPVSESGTFEVTFTDLSYQNSDGTYSVSKHMCRYYKVGHLVHISVLLENVSSAMSGDFTITGLPFIPADSHTFGIGQTVPPEDSSGPHSPFFVKLVPETKAMELYRTDATTYTPQRIHELHSGLFSLGFSMSYTINE